MQFQQGSVQAFDGFAGCGQSLRFAAVGRTIVLYPNTPLVTGFRPIANCVR